MERITQKMEIEISGAIPGIKRLDQRQAEIRSGESIVPGVWYVDGIRYDTATFEDTRRIIIAHRTAIERFKALNERINQRALKKIPVLTSS